MKNKFITALALLSAFALEAEAPLWLRNTAISPDGETIAFTFKGNVWTVPATGGQARPITSGKGFNSTPFWSPDGKKIAFTSDREKSVDIYIVDAKGGTPARLTTNTSQENILGFKDNNTILYTSSLEAAPESATGSFFPQVYEVSTTGGRPRLVTSISMKAADVDASGRILYQDKKGVENNFRKHENSSATGDVWLLDNNSYKKLTSFGGNDMNPVWGTGDTYYYTTEEDGTLNVWSNTLDGKQKKQLTKFQRHPVRSLSSSDNGKLAFSWDGEIYTLVPGKEPQKVNVEIITDDYTPSPIKDIRSGGVRNFAISPDGETIAFILEGDVYLTSVKYETTRRVTDTPEQERSVDFAPDGRSIVYDSERDGLWQIFTTEIKDPKEKSLLYATELIEKPLYKSDKPAFYPDYSPDGKKLGFIEDRTIIQVMDLDTKKITTALDGKYNYSYSDGDVGFEWSPDSKWLVCDYIGIGGWNNKDIALVKADGSEVIDLTESGYSDGGAQWALDGKAIVWSTGKYGYKSHGSWGNDEDVMVMFLDGKANERFKMTEEEIALAEKAEKEKKDTEENGDKKEDRKSVV